jgi:hypothetical protein
VFACILNQCIGHWLLGDTLNSSISMSLKFKDEIGFATFDHLMEKNGMLFMSYHVWPPT